MFGASNTEYADYVIIFKILKFPSRAFAYVKK